MTGPNAVIAYHMTHAELSGQVMFLAESKDLLVYQNPYSRRTPDGFPDLVIAGPCGTIFAHLLTESEDLRPRQRLWAEFLVKAGACWWLWRPLSLYHGVIGRELEEIR